MKDFRKLNVWEKSHKLTLKIYKVTKSFPKDELFNLVSQIRRASSSIPTNLAEGCGRFSDVDFARFCTISFGSANELEYLLLLSFDLKYLSKDVYDELTLDLIEIKKMISSLIQNLKSN